MQEIIEKHFRANYDTLVKKLRRPAETEWNAEDVVQTAFERALRYQHSYDPSQSFDAWFNTILRNSLIDKLNEDRGIIFEEVEEFDWEAPQTLDVEQIQRTIVEMIKDEPQDNQPILELFFLKGYKAKEIYECNKVSYPNTRKIIQRFRDKAKARLTVEQ